MPEDGSTAGDFRWPQTLYEPPSVPQRLTIDRDNSQLHSAEVLNAFAGEQWAAGTTKKALPHKLYCAPSDELTRVLKEHLSRTATLPSLLADLEEAEQGIKKKQIDQWHADMAVESVRKPVCSFSGSLVLPNEPNS